MMELDSMYDGVDPTWICAGANELHLLSEKDNHEEDPEEDKGNLEDNDDLEQDYGDEG